MDFTPTALPEVVLVKPRVFQDARGYFFETWHHGQNWQRFQITAKECPRISGEYLEAEMRELGPLLYSQEFEGQFIDPEGSTFDSELIAMALVDDFDPPWPEVA